MDHGISFRELWPTAFRFRFTVYKVCFPKCIFCLCIFAKCTWLMHLLSFASLVHKAFTAISKFRLVKYGWEHLRANGARGVWWIHFCSNGEPVESLQLSKFQLKLPYFMNKLLSIKPEEELTQKLAKSRNLETLGVMTALKPRSDKNNVLYCKLIFPKCNFLKAYVKYILEDQNYFWGNVH